MKKFAFTLERALDWRSAQARVEEANLERLQSELQAIVARQDGILRGTVECTSLVFQSDVVPGVELAALDVFRNAARAENQRLDRARSQCQRRIAAQVNQVAERRRAARLLERLKERQWQAWKLEVDRDAEREANDQFLARWK